MRNFRPRRWSHSARRRRRAAWRREPAAPVPADGARHRAARPRGRRARRGRSADRRHRPGHRQRSGAADSGRPATSTPRLAKPVAPVPAGATGPCPCRLTRLGLLDLHAQQDGGRGGTIGVEPVVERSSTTDASSFCTAPGASAAGGARSAAPPRRRRPERPPPIPGPASWPTPTDLGMIGRWSPGRRRPEPGPLRTTVLAFRRPPGRPAAARSQRRAPLGLSRAASRRTVPQRLTQPVSWCAFVHGRATVGWAPSWSGWGSRGRSPPPGCRDPRSG
jgi:hypothetical protein